MMYKIQNTIEAGKTRTIKSTAPTIIINIALQYTGDNNKKYTNVIERKQERNSKGRYIMLRYTIKNANQPNNFFSYEYLTCISCFSQKSSYARKKNTVLKL